MEFSAGLPLHPPHPAGRRAGGGGGGLVLLLLVHAGGGGGVLSLELGLDDVEGRGHAAAVQAGVAQGRGGGGVGGGAATPRRRGCAAGKCAACADTVEVSLRLLGAFLSAALSLSTSSCSHKIYFPTLE